MVMPFAGKALDQAKHCLEIKLGAAGNTGIISLPVRGFDEILCSI